jgi:glycerol-3-phosphate O-acyltransferase / dihydroxyacetone phosphate acyltransferase
VETADCELWGEGWPAQPIATWSSMAYVVAGALVVWWAMRRRWSRWFVPFGVVLALEGLGSVAFHGEGGDAAQVLHDAPLIGMLGFVAAWQVARVTAPSNVPRLGRWATVGAVLGSAVGVIAAGAGATAGVSGAVAGLIVVSEVVARRRGAAPVWTGGLVALLIAAGAAWWLGSTVGPLCDPGSPVQLHGAWHVLTAVIAVTWAERASIAVDPVGAPRLWRAVTDRFVAGVARGLSYAFYRSVDVVGRENVPWGRPMLVVANHANGFVDPVLVASALGRLPRFMAKAALWKVPVARPLLAFAGVLPVHRREDGDEIGANRSVFEACHAEHASGGMVAIFPEGTTGDRAALDRVRSGAARIALGSLPVAPDLVVVPVGLAFESRTETRGRALVQFARPIQPAPTRAITGDEPDHDDVRALTEQIRASLAEVSPDFASVEERDVLRAAAGVRLAVLDRRRAERFGEIEVLARRIAAAADDDRSAVVAAYTRYAARLQLIGLRDRQLRRGSTSWSRLVGSALVVAALGSVVVTAVVVHLPALVVTWAATAAVRSTATKGTVRVLVGLVTGLATWVLFGMAVADGWAAVLAGAVVAVEGAVALAVLPPLLRWVDDLWGRIRMRDRAALLPPVLEAREELSGAVEAAAR